MLKKLLLIGAGTSIGAVLAQLSFTIPMIRKLPRTSRVDLDGVITIEDAIQECLKSKLESWELVAFAQNLAACKFTYSRLNPWDTPGKAFERGRGYCLQEAMALKQILDALDIQSRVVFATRCHFPPKKIDGKLEPERNSGHSWLRVKIGDDERDVCPGSIRNMPGLVHFTVLSPVRTLYQPLHLLPHVVSILENIRRYEVARLR